MIDNLDPQGSSRTGDMVRLGSTEGLSSETARLTARMARGDEAAYQEFFEAYFDRLFRYLLVVVKGREDAAREALQLTLLRVVKHVRPFDSEPVFWSWLTVLARSAVVDEQRKRQRYSGLLAAFFRHRSAFDDLPPQETDEPLGEVLHIELAALPAADRQLVQRKYEAGQSVREMALDLGLSEKAIESRLTRARQRLKDAVLRRLNHHE